MNETIDPFFLDSFMSSDLGLILRTASFAARAHRTQTRKNLVRTPYINHPLQVSELIATPPSSLAAAPPPVILQAALLHDVLEDTDVTSAELRAAFGDKVLSIVLECSDDMRETSEVRKERQVREANGKSVEASTSAPPPSSSTDASAQSTSS